LKEWRRVPSDTLCGYCGRVIAREIPALFTRLPNIKRERVRCQECAGPAPPDLPPRVILRGETVDGVRSGTTRRMRPLKSAIPYDYTNRLLGERE
jgi:hypothetical protein